MNHIASTAERLEGIHKGYLVTDVNDFHSGIKDGLLYNIMITIQFLSSKN